MVKEDDGTQAGKVTGLGQRRLEAGEYRNKTTEVEVKAPPRVKFIPEISKGL